MSAEHFTADELERARRAWSRYQRHTFDIDKRPMSVEDETPKSYAGAVVAWVALFVLVGAYVVWLVEKVHGANP